MKKEATDTSSLAHTKWNCKYHIVFAPKYRKKVFFREMVEDTRSTPSTMPMERRGYNRGRSVPGHIHLLVSIPHKMSVSGFMGYLKGKVTF